MKNLKQTLLSPGCTSCPMSLLLLVKLMNPFLVDSMKLKYYDYLDAG
jgi:hypothetical protein